MAAVSARVLSIEGRRVRVWSGGASGPVLLLLHGGWARAELAWSPVWEALVAATIAPLLAEPDPPALPTAPVLLLWGARDPIAPVEGARRLAATIPGARLRLVEEAGHFPQIEQPREVVEALAAFVSETLTRA